MNAPTLKYKVLKPDTHFDCAEFSLCPNCSSNIIRLADDGMRDTSRIPCCSLCGWSKEGVLQGGKENCSSNCSGTSTHKLSIPCLIKQPKRAETKGIIQKDLGDRFSVYISSNGTTVNVSKLLVYPDFSDVGDKRLQGGLAKCSSNCSSTLDKSSSKNDADINQKVSDTLDKSSSKITSPPCTKTDKHRRHKGEGSGHIYYRTVTRNGKKYQQAYYQWRENGKQRTKYISKKLLPLVEEAEARKLPVSEILVLLGGTDKCSSKSSDTSIVHIDDEVVNASNECSSKVAPPSKRKRKQGEGTGYIECKPIKRSGKEYKQYWYHYEEWEEGVASHSPRRDRTVKKSKYIPKRLVQKIERMNREKLAVKGILEVLKNKRKK